MTANSTMKVANAIFSRLLCSPLHFLASHGLMLITVTGRKTGKTYTTPVAYLREGEIVYFFSNCHLAWIKNLQGGAPVQLRLRGQELQGKAALVQDDPATRKRLLKRMYPYLSTEKLDGLGLFKVSLMD